MTQTPPTGVTSFPSIGIISSAICRTVLLAVIYCGLSTAITRAEDAAPHEKAAELLREDPPRQAEALALLEESRGEGDERGAELLAWLYLEGPAGSRRPGEAASIYRKAAEKGSESARHNLALLMLEGRGTERDAAAALTSLQTNADNGYLPSILKLAEIHFFGGGGIPRDFEKAMPYLLQAAARDSAWAENLLGAAYQHGQGVAPCRSTAIHWYQLAAHRGYSRAMANLGILLRSGPPESHDMPGTIMWLTLAAERGEATAINMLEDVGDRFSEADRSEARRRIDAFRARAGNVTDPSPVK